MQRIDGVDGTLVLGYLPLRFDKADSRAHGWLEWLCKLKTDSQLANREEICV